MPEVSDPTTERMRKETGHDCIACPTDVRNLLACAHNLLTRLDSNDYSGVHRKAEDLRRAVAKLQESADGHFAVLGAWRRP